MLMSLMVTYNDDFLCSKLNYVELILTSTGEEWSFVVYFAALGKVRTRVYLWVWLLTVRGVVSFPMAFTFGEI